jgi:hypothetical protein
MTGHIVEVPMKPRFIRCLVLLASVGSPWGGALAQDYPWPRAAGTPADACAVCPDPYTGLPTYPYSAPFVRHLGRFLDSHHTNDYQTPVRTLRAKVARAPATRERVFMILGSTFVSYDRATFFASTLGKPMIEAPPHTYASVTVPGEQFLKPDGAFYAEHGWNTGVNVDGQDRLFGFDWDDRGYVYLAYSAFRWGILNDNANATLTSVLHAPVPPPPALNYGSHRIAAFRKGTQYLVHSSSASAQNSDLWDVTNPQVPVHLKQVQYQGARELAKTTDDGQVIAMIDRGRQLRIYSPAKLALMGEADATFSGAAGYVDVTTDGTNLWVLEQTATTAAPAYIAKYAPSTPGVAASYTLVDRLLFDSSVRVDGTLYSGIRYGDGYLGVHGRATVGFVFRLYKLTPAGLTEVPLGDSLPKYYYVPPDGYATPRWSSYMDIHFGLLPVKHAGKLHLIFSGYGMGDVFEVDVSAYEGGPDAGAPIESDAGAPVDPVATEPDWPDAGTGRNDAGGAATADAGREQQGVFAEGGCGCAAASVGLIPGALAGLALLGHRRRRTGA